MSTIELMSLESMKDTMLAFIDSSYCSMEKSIIWSSFSGSTIQGRTLDIPLGPVIIYDRWGGGGPSKFYLSEKKTKLFFKNTTQPA